MAAASRAALDDRRLARRAAPGLRQALSRLAWQLGSWRRLLGESRHHVAEAERSKPSSQSLFAHGSPLKLGSHPKTRACACAKCDLIALIKRPPRGGRVLRRRLCRCVIADGAPIRECRIA